MSTSASTQTPSRLMLDPRIILICGSVIALIAVGTRHSFGLFLNPVTQDIPSLDRELFGFAIALQNLMWGLAQPIAGMIADRFGSARVIAVGGLLYVFGLLVASVSTSALGLIVGLGCFVGVGLSATTYAVVLGAVGRRFAPEKRATALGIASLGGSIGIFLSVPITLGLIDNFGWSLAFVGLALLVLTVVLMAPVLNGRAEVRRSGQTMKTALSEALSHKGYLMLVAGFFVCGFQLTFIGTHLPAYLADQNLEQWVGGAALATIGATNIIGTYVCGALGDKVSKKNALAVLYIIRSITVGLFILLPTSVATTLLFAAAIGFTWLGTVPLTSAIVAQIFGPTYLATLVGIVFLMHQLGSFLGAWLGGLIFEITGSYDLIWWSVVMSGVLAALIHWPIDEQPINTSTIQPSGMTDA